MQADAKADTGLKISLPPSESLCCAEQLMLLDKVDVRNAVMKKRRADLLLTLDRPDEALQELCTLPELDRDSETLFAMAKAQRQIGGEDMEGRARELLTGLRDHGDAESPDILIELGDIHRKRGELQTALGLFREALDIAPANHMALRKTAVTLFDLGLVEELHAICEELLDAGINHTRLHGTWFAVLAALGRIDEARAVRGFETDFRKQSLAAPDGSTDPAAFNRALAGEIMASPAMRFENSRQASCESWRVDELMVRSMPATTALLEAIADAVEHYAEAIARTEQSDPRGLFVERMPERGRIRPWSIITREKGHEAWHTHDKGWLSGTYYAAVPDGLAHRDDKAGAIEFGWPDRLLGEGASERLGNKLVRPRPGMLLLFPSHIHHRTWPHGRTEDRICVSFDIMPA
ncbi:MAG: hypothetical protein HKN78_02550 [Sphingomonadaceae bacterium]|nr:hypothetical protein [Sphingomonadaceae bacterium]